MIKLILLLLAHTIRTRTTVTDLEKKYAMDLFSIDEAYAHLYYSQYIVKAEKSVEAFKDAHKKHMFNRVKFVVEYLNKMLLNKEIPTRLSESMRYSLLAGGKRIRPILCLSCAKLCSEDFEMQWLSALPFAAALEMIHTYSLVHDDLPAMDDDDLRRGKPTCHKAYDEGTAILAGDGLLTDAFYYMTTCDLPANRVLEAIKLISLAVGSEGMVGGQTLDLEAEGKRISHEELCVLNAKKTGALLRSACESGAVLAGASENVQESIAKYGNAIGIAFQIIDDVLDIEGDAKLLGKNIGSDTNNEKATWPALIGLEESKKQAKIYCAEAVQIIEDINNDGELINQLEMKFLQKTAHDMAHRVY